MKISFRLPAHEGEVFTSATVRSLIGQRPPVHLRAQLRDRVPAVVTDLGQCEVTDARLVDDGRAILITIDAP